VDGTVAAIAVELVARSRELTIRVNELEAEIKAIVRRLAPSLLALSGCGVLSAAKIVGETAAQPGSAPPPRSLVGMALRPSRCRPARPTANGSTGAATAR
jgi:transposase